MSGAVEATYGVVHDSEGRWAQWTEPADYGAEVLADDPVASWRFSEATGQSVLADSSGNGHGAAFWVNAGSDPLLGQRGAIAADDGAVRFDGSADAVGVPWDEDFVFDGSFSLEFWAKSHASSPLAGDVGIIDNGGHPSDGDGAFRVQVDDVDQRLVFRRDAGQDLAAGASLGEEWQHFVVTYDAEVDTLVWYAGGEVDATYAGVVFGADTNGEGLRLGRDPFASVSLDEVAVYDEALSAERVAAHHEVGRGVERVRVEYSPAGRMVSVTSEVVDGAGGWRPTFADVRGYDAVGQLAEVGWVDYDPEGVVEAADETSLVWDPGWAVPQILEFDHDGTVTREHYGIHRISQNAGGGARWFAYDAHDNVVASTGIAAPSGYDPFGAPIGAPGEQLWFGYRGELHTTGGLVHLRNRDYQPGGGQFTTPDPLPGVTGTPTVTNPYHYTDNDPLNKVDPLGLRPVGPGDAAGVGKDRGVRPEYVLSCGGRRLERSDLVWQAPLWNFHRVAREVRAAESSGMVNGGVRVQVGEAANGDPVYGNMCWDAFWSTYHAQHSLRLCGIGGDVFMEGSPEFRGWLPDGSCRVEFGVCVDPDLGGPWYLDGLAQWSCANRHWAVPAAVAVLFGSVVVVTGGSGHAILAGCAGGAGVSVITSGGDGEATFHGCLIGGAGGAGASLYKGERLLAIVGACSGALAAATYLSGGLEAGLLACLGSGGTTAVRVAPVHYAERAAYDCVIRGLTTGGTYDKDFLDGLAADEAWVKE